MENIRIGDIPWKVESLTDRFRRVVTLSGINVNPVIAPGIADVQLSWQDVDSQGATGLLKDFAQSADAVLWAAVHQSTGPYINLEDPTKRAPLFVLARGSDALVHIVHLEGAPDAQNISACDVLRSPIIWEQSVSDITTRVAITWLEQGVDDEGRPETTERTVKIVDTGLEKRFGQRGIQLTTLLATVDAARTVAGRIRAPGWRAQGITIIDAETLETFDRDTVSMLLRLLDGTARNGLPVRITNLPDWSPAGTTLPAYLEGGTCTYVDGGWNLALTTTPAEGQGGPAVWDELPQDWAWDDFDPHIAWDDLAGVGPPERNTTP